MALHGMGLHGKGGKRNLLTEKLAEKAKARGERLWVPELAEHHDQSERNITVVRNMAVLAERVHAYLGQDSNIPKRIVGHSHGAGKVLAETLQRYPEDADVIDDVHLLNPLIGPINPFFVKYMRGKMVEKNAQTDMEKALATSLLAEDLTSPVHVIHAAISGKAEGLILPDSQFTELEDPSERSQEAAAHMFELLGPKLSIILGTKDKWLGPVDQQKELIRSLGGGAIDIVELDIDHNASRVETEIASRCLRETMRI